jgi:hypothetical protein
MSRRTLSGVTAVAVVLGFAASAATVPAQAPAPSRARLDMVNPGDSFKPNRFIRSRLRYSKDAPVIASGGTLVVRNRTGQPHSLSFVPRARLPRTIKAVARCGAPRTICAQLGIAHQIDQSGNPRKAVVDVGRPGIDTASSGGDSFVFSPKGQKGARLTIVVSAPAGSNLSYFCGIHPWMQGVLRVR